MYLGNYECFGGPLDGKTIPVPEQMPDGSPGLHAFMTHIGPDGVPHFYAMSPQADGTVVLEYGGTDPRGVVAIVRKTLPEMADKLAADLDEIFNDNEAEFADDSETD